MLFVLFFLFPDAIDAELIFLFSKRMNLGVSVFLVWLRAGA